MSVDDEEHTMNDTTGAEDAIERWVDSAIEYISDAESLGELTEEMWPRGDDFDQAIAERYEKVEHFQEAVYCELLRRIAVTAMQRATSPLYDDALALTRKHGLRTVTR